NGATNSDQREVVGGGGGRCLGKSDRSRGAGIERTYRRSKKRTGDRMHCGPKHLWRPASLLGAPGRFQQKVRTECADQLYGGSPTAGQRCSTQFPNPKGEKNITHRSHTGAHG